MNRCRMSVAAAVLATALAASTITPAAAEPATTVRYPTGASATRLSGYAFDTCPRRHSQRCRPGMHRLTTGSASTSEV